MKLSDFDYKLPDKLIATYPAEPRDSSRLLILDKKTGKIEHKHFYDIVDYLNPGDVLVLNNSKVIPARLFGYKKGTGGKVEVLLHKKIGGGTWQCLLGGRVSEKLELSFRGASATRNRLNDKQALRDSSPAKGGIGMTKKSDLSAKILKNNHDGTWNLRFNKSGQVLMRAIEKVGEMPLPPYIVKQREKELSFRISVRSEKSLKVCVSKKALRDFSLSLGRTKMDDKKDYQTVYADDKKAGSVAAPTAGLHFTPKLLARLKKKGVKILEITLYVGMGTFAPVVIENIKKHKMHAEWVEISSKVIKDLKSLLDSRLRGNDTKEGNLDMKKDRNSANKKKVNDIRGRIIAVGTTSARSLEACWQSITTPTPTPSNSPSGRGRNILKRRGTKIQTKGFKEWVDIFIYPGYKFKIVDGLITNFHLPKSTLLMLISALAGKKNIDKAYQEAIKRKYRFYSYGDAMFIK